MIDTNDIRPQGYQYYEEPEALPGLTSATKNKKFTADVSQTTGEASVVVSENEDVVNFSFRGIKGEKGDAGETGPQGEAGKSVTVTSTGSHTSGAVAGSVIDGKGNYMTVYNGDKGEAGPQGPQGPEGPQGPQGPVGESPDVSNLLAEVADKVTEANGYDKHEIKETENNGTVNDVGHFIVAQKQITALNADGSFKTVDQNGVEETGQISAGSSSRAYNLTLNGTVSGVTPSDETIFRNKSVWLIRFSPIIKQGKNTIFSDVVQVLIMPQTNKAQASNDDMAIEPIQYGNGKTSFIIIASSFDIYNSSKAVSVTMNIFAPDGEDLTGSIAWCYCIQIGALS